jgi:cation diffusion facilitator CzcD-associated flavoprotein CzcO
MADPLARLAEEVRCDLARLDYPSRPWVRPRQHKGEPVFDVVIVGAGQSGLAAGFGLLREHVENIVALDENPEGQEGPWITYARMVTLRTPKYLVGQELGVPSLTFRAWWEVQHGEAAWDALDKIPREEWMRYLRWYRATLGLPVRNECRVDLIEPTEPQLFRLTVSGAGAPRQGFVLARKVVLATGIQGGGEWHVPRFIADVLPPSRYAHTSGPVDYAAMQGWTIGILGGGASAFDNAQFGLRLGVGEMHVFLRRGDLQRVNPIRHIENAGFLGQFAALDDATKYRAIAHFLSLSQPPTNDTFRRAAAYPGFRLHLGAPWLKVEDTRDGIIVTTPQGPSRFDFVVLSTGLLTDASLRPELRLVAGDIALWKDRYVPSAGTANVLVDQHPYLGPHFELTGKNDDAAARVYGLFALNYSALASLGLSASSLSGTKYALPRLVAGVARQLFLDDRDIIMRDYFDYREEEFVGNWPAS